MLGSKMHSFGECAYDETDFFCDTLHHFAKQRPLHDVGIDILRGKIAQCYHRMRTVSAQQHTSLSAACHCKFLVLVDTRPQPQCWVVQLANRKTRASNRNHYLNCIHSIQLYNTVDAVCANKNAIETFDGTVWYLFEALIKQHIAENTDVLLEDFVECDECISGK